MSHTATLSGPLVAVIPPPNPLKAVALVLVVVLAVSNGLFGGDTSVFADSPLSATSFASFDASTLGGK
jgi:hypothetical protein